MPDRAKLVFFHSPQTRSSGVLALLEELGADYELRLLNMKAGEQRGAAYLAINPMGKVPAIQHGAALVTEQAAVYQYLAEIFPEQGMAPPPGDPLRGPFLRWLAFYGSSFEPALIDRSLKRDPAAPGTSPYGDWDTMFKTLVGQLSNGPWLLGERFTAADVLWGSALQWTSMFGLIPPTREIEAYVQRVTSRPAFVRARERDAQLAAAQAASPPQA
jgi:glutathione S-transferase